MQNDEMMDRRRTLANHFEDVFQRLLSGETLDLYAAGVSRIFEIIATRLLAETTGREQHWYDGVVSLRARIRKAHQIEFNGEMWVGDGEKQWKEEFRARVTDQRITKQGIRITLWIGSDRAEEDLPSAFGLVE